LRIQSKSAMYSPPEGNTATVSDCPNSAAVAGPPSPEYPDVPSPATVQVQPLGFGLGQFAVEGQCLGPDDQVVREHHDVQPHLVERKLLKRELGQAGVLVIADAVLDVRGLAMAAFDDRDVLIGLVGEDRLEAVAVVVGERHLRSGVRTPTAHDQPEPLGPGRQINRVGDLTDLPLSRAEPS
jgi:hypothetical protein